MEELKDIERYRKKQNRKKLLKRLLIFLAIAVIALFGFSVYRSYTEEGTFDLFDLFHTSSSFPVRLSGNTVVESRMMGNTIVLLTDRDCAFYTKRGSEIQKQSHGFADPNLKTSSKRALLYDLDGTKFMTASKTGVMLEKELSNRIVFGEIAENGTIAMVTHDDHYACRLTVYNETGEEIFKWYSAEQLITAVDFTDHGSGCVVASINTSGGLMQTSVYGLDFSKQDPLFSTDLENCMAVSIQQKSNGNLQLVTDRSMITLKENGELVSTYSFQKDLKNYSGQLDGYTVLLLGEDVKSQQTAVVLDANGEQVSQVELQERVRKLDAKDGNLYFLTSDKILVYDLKLEHPTVLEGQTATEMVLGDGQTVYSFNHSELKQLTLG